MKPSVKIRRSIRQDTVRKLTAHLANSYLGLRLTPGQLKQAARKLYAVKFAEERRKQHV